MIRSDRFCAGKLLFCLWITILFYIVTEGRVYDKCTTGDGRQGVCVVKRYCREASQHELLPCERDEENHCCPIPTTQRSAPTLPPPVLDKPREEDPYKPETEVKRVNTDVYREPSRDDQLNKTPVQEERRTPIEKTEDYDSERRKSYEYPENPGIFIERPRHNPQRRPVALPNDPDRRDHFIRQPDRDRGVLQPERDPPVRQSNRDHGVRQPEIYPARQPEIYPVRQPESYPVRQPERESPVRQPTRDHGVRQPERDPPIRQPTRDPNARQPERDPPIRQSNRDHGVRQPERDPPVRQPNREHVVRQPERDRLYPVRDNIEIPRSTSPPRWHSFDSRIPTRRNRTTDDTSKFPITFPEPYERSVPRPTVPACGVKPYDLFIAGGQESAEHEWPWMTAIFRRYPDSRPKTFLCGGSLINTKYVLTAAHCFVNNYVILPASSFVVRLGSHYLDSGEEYTVANLVIHHNHSGSDFFNDIALVRLASEVYITDKIAPICLPPPDMIHQSLVGRLATVAGWGDTAFRTSGTRILQHVTVPIVSGDECFAAYSRVRGAAFLARGSDHVICAGLREGGKDACLGDSGGPLMLKMPDDRYVIVGIVSLGYKCAEPGYPGVYTRVTHYMSWINTNMKRY